MIGDMPQGILPDYFPLALAILNIVLEDNRALRCLADHNVRQIRFIADIVKHLNAK